MAAALVPLQNITLGSAQATVTFASIPSTFRDLRLVVQPIMVASGPVEAGIIFNGDTGGNYSRVYAEGSGSSVGSSSQSGVTRLIVLYHNSTLQGNSLVDVMDYSATDKHKTVLSRLNNTAVLTGMGAGRWASTTAVNSIQFAALNGTSFAAGSTFALFGVVA